MKENFDILIAGAGFAGSLTALVLHNSGFKVCIVEKGRHPRFAIGESSTPIADMLLRSLSEKYKLPWLHDFSRYGTWQQTHPEVACGIKRGFSYFKHYPGKQFIADAAHSNELLVAASVSDTASDTNWFRADFDAFLAGKVQEAGIVYYDLTEIIAVQKSSAWIFDICRDNSVSQIEAAFYIDATGGGHLLEKLFGVTSSSADFLTNSFGVFSHFRNVPCWTETMMQKGFSTADFPYNPDNSALHHVLDEGWMWVLRFNNGLTSFGFALNGWDKQFDGMDAMEIWEKMRAKYPSVNDIIQASALAKTPGYIIKSQRLQRKTAQCFGEGWVALPHSCGFVDPLFSSGIAHSLSGIEKITSLLNQYWGNDKILHNNLQQYEKAVFTELRLVDMLVAGCYDTMRHFPLFNAWAMLYFAATITSEQRRLKGEPPGYFLGADDAGIQEMVTTSYAELKQILLNNQPAGQDIQNFITHVRGRIKPVNIAGLMDPDAKNMYHHTVARL